MITIIAMLQTGWALVPIPYGKKGPTSEGWNLREQCITSAGMAHRLEGINVGLAHAYCTPNPTCAIDIDDYGQSKQWFAARGIDVDSLLSANEAVVIWSGKKYSLKLLYRLPLNVPPLVSKKINGIDGKSILEFRCATKDGKTVQDVLPPSIHPEGHQYRWFGENPLNPPDLPSCLLELWQVILAANQRIDRRDPSPIQTDCSRPETPRQIAIVRDLLSQIDADCDYETWRNVIWATLSTGWKCAEDLALEWSRSAPDRFEWDAFWNVANSYEPDHEAPITLGTLYFYAREGGQS